MTNSMKQPLTIIKVGGKIVEDPTSLAALLDGFKQIPGNKMLVHGGGRTATQVALRLGYETKMIDGRRVTDADMLWVVTMVYGGLVNKNIVAQLNSRGVCALGMTGADCGVIISHKRKATPVDYGFVGDVDKVDSSRLASIINQGITPVFAPLTFDVHGNLLNTNADTIAGETAKAMAHIYDVSLVYCFEKRGVLSNPDDDNSVIAEIHAPDFPKLVGDGVVSGGMIPKIQNALQAVEAGVKRVIITAAKGLDIEGGTKILP
mgnify:CR=1 FL=1